MYFMYLFILSVKQSITGAPVFLIGSHFTYRCDVSLIHTRICPCPCKEGLQEEQRYDCTRSSPRQHCMEVSGQL